jgi:hypothetical protein
LESAILGVVPNPSVIIAGGPSDAPDLARQGEGRQPSA